MYISGRHRRSVITQGAGAFVKAGRISGRTRRCCFLLQRVYSGAWDGGGTDDRKGK